MKNLINKILAAANKYTVLDYSLLKLTLVSLGILIGTYFSSFFSNHTSLLLIIFLISYIGIIYRTFIKHKD
jgi:small multidrug resistance family-3 protein